MANFFSSAFWKALYFKAMGGQATAVDPNAMRGSFAGSSSWTGTLELPQGAIFGAFAGSSEFTGTINPTPPLVLNFGGGFAEWEKRRTRVVEDNWKKDDLDELEALIKSAMRRLDSPEPSKPAPQTIKAIDRRLEEGGASKLPDIDNGLKDFGLALDKLRQEIIAARQEIERQQQEDDEIMILLLAA